VVLGYDGQIWFKYATGDDWSGGETIPVTGPVASPAALASYKGLLYAACLGT
jgi:hypothetical protein